MTGIRMLARRLGAVALLATAVLSLGLAPPAPAPSRWHERLEQLDPSRPMAYFELAEEVADGADDADETRLARRLFGLAGALDPEGLGRSACLALADLEEHGPGRRRLLALAALLGGDEYGPTVETGVDSALVESSSLDAIVALTEAFSHYRRGRGAQAQTALREEGAMALLEACDRFLPGGHRRFLEDCKHYRGQLRPNLTEGEIDRMLRLEVALLAGADRPWSSELLFTRGDALVEVDPERLSDELGVTTDAPLFRDGRWVSLSGGPDG